MLRAQTLGPLVLSASLIVVGCGESTTKTGLTPEFAEIAGSAQAYIKSDLLPAIGTARFPTMVATSRARVKSAEAKIGNDADKGLWLILMMINVKSNESNSMQEELLVRPNRAARSAMDDLNNEREHCVSEADQWLSAPPKFVVARLNDLPCVKLARQAAAMLGR
jgi:hypothetical protein